MKHTLFFLYIFCLIAVSSLAAPIASISYSGWPPDTTCAGKNACFSTWATVFTDSMVIDWGDGSLKEKYTVNPNFICHTFSSTSVIKLIAYEGAMSDTATTQIYILQMPVSKFTTNYVTTCAKKNGVTVNFTNTTNGGTPPYIFDWDFGDGKTDTVKDPVHTYYSPGKYIIRLISKPKKIPLGLFCDPIIYTDSITISVDSSLITSMIANAGCPCNIISFTTTGNSNSWLWDFGDGYTSAAQNPSHSYSEPGQYVVTLSGTGSNGCYFVKKIPLTVCGGSIGKVSKSNYRWYFGGGNSSANPTFDAGGINFNPAIPTPLTTGAQTAMEGCATMSDANTGNLLFYTNGMKVWDNTHTVMPNGTGLFGGISTTQSSLIVPFPGNRNKYYIITANGTTDISKGYYYSIVDMTLNAGKGDVISKNNVFFIGPCKYDNFPASGVAHEALTGTVKYKGDCLKPAEYWVVIPSCRDTFKAFLITSAGINPPVTSVAASDNYNGAGYSCISPDGSKYAISQYSTGGTNKIRVFDFDKNTGLLSNERVITYFFGFGYENFYGVAFSPNSSVLYAPFSSTFYQWDLNAANISASLYRTTLAGANMWGSYLGPDKKIYLANTGGTSLTVINNPDVVGPGCNVTVNSFSLSGRKSRYGLQNIIPLAPLDTIPLKADFLATIDPCSRQVTFSNSSCSFMPDSIITKWYYGDGTTGTFKTLQFPPHTYSVAGTYQVKLVISKSCYKSDSIVKTIIVNPDLTVSISTVQPGCGNSNGSVSATPSGGIPGYTYLWSNSQTTQTATGLTQGNYTVTITDNKGCTTSTVAIITGGTPVSGSFTKGTANCPGCGCKEWLMVNAGGGTAPYTYLWSNGYTNRYGNRLCPGSYTINIKDKNGCSVNVNLSVP